MVRIEVRIDEAYTSLEVDERLLELAAGSSQGRKVVYDHIRMAAEATLQLLTANGKRDSDSLAKGGDDA